MLDTWKNKPLRLTRFFYDPNEFAGRFGQFYFLTEDVRELESHEAGDKKIERKSAFKNPLVVEDEYEALKKFYPTKYEQIMDASISLFDTLVNPHTYYINSFQYLDNLLANKAKQSGYDAIIYTKRDSWGSTQTEVQDLRYYKIKHLKISIEELLKKTKDQDELK